MSTRQAKILFYASLIMITFFVKIAFAFTDMSIKKLDIEMQKIMQQAKQGNRNAAVRFQKALEVLSKIDTSKHTREEIIDRLQDFIKAGKIPSYIFDNRGQYGYVENNNVLYLVGTNIRLRSQPNTQARIVATLNTETTDYLAYLGEWKNPKGERWVLAMNSLDNDSFGELGWVSGKYVRLVPNITLQNIISKVKGQSTTSNQNVSSNQYTSIKIISLENHLLVTLKKYSFFGLIFWLISFFVVFMIVGWEFNLDNVLAFLFYSIAITLGVLVVCCLVYFIWKNVILPIISAIMTVIGWILVLLSAGPPKPPNGENEGATSGGPCSYYNRDYCKGCPKLNPYNHKYVNFYTDIQWCNDLYGYVNPEKSPYDNINGY